MQELYHFSIWKQPNETSSPKSSLHFPVRRFYQKKKERSVLIETRRFLQSLLNCAMHIALFQILQICDIDAMRNRDKTMTTMYDFILFILTYVLYADDNLSRGYLIHNFSNNSLKINVMLTPYLLYFRKTIIFIIYLTYFFNNITFTQFSYIIPLLHS